MPVIKLQSVPSSGVIKLYERTEVTPDTNVVYLYAVPASGIVTLHSGIEAAGTLTGTAAWTNGGDTWVGVGKETLSGAGAFTAGNDAWVGVGDTGSGGGGGTQNTYAPTNVHPRANLPVRLVGYEHVPAGVKRAGIIGTKTRKTE